MLVGQEASIALNGKGHFNNRLRKLEGWKTWTLLSPQSSFGSIMVDSPR